MRYKNHQHCREPSKKHREPNTGMNDSNSDLDMFRCNFIYCTYIYIYVGSCLLIKKKKQRENMLKLKYSDQSLHAMQGPLKRRDTK